MTLNASIVENAVREWFLLREGFEGQVCEPGDAVGHGPLASDEPSADWRFNKNRKARQE